MVLRRETNTGWWQWQIMRVHFTMACQTGPSMSKYLAWFLVPLSQSTLLTPENSAAVGKVTKAAKLDWNLTWEKKKIYEITMAFYMATGHESIGYLPSFTRVSNHSPPTYIFHVPHKKKPAAKIKYLIAIPLSKYTSVARCNLVVGRHRVLASCGCPAREGQAGLCPGPSDVIHSTHCTCVTPVTYSCEPTGAEGVPTDCWAEWYCFKHGSYQRKNS